MSLEWCGISAAARGARQFMADAVARSAPNPRRWPVKVGVVADGIGDSALAAALARGVCERASASVAHGLKGAARYWPGRVGAALMRTFPAENDAGIAGTTLAVGATDGRHLIAAWAGDSRVYVMDASAGLVLVTRDHADEEQALTNFVSENARLIAPASVVHWRGAVLAMLVCSDGIHGSCRKEELEDFVRWTIQSRVKDDAAFTWAVEGFIGHSLRDNASAVLWYRRYAVGRRATAWRR